MGDRGPVARGPVADALPGHWVDSWLPTAARPYARLMRLDRPIGWWLLLWPCWWSLALAGIAAGRAPDPTHLTLFWIGAVVMRGAGCTYNDIVDRDIDRHVARTRSRPIPSGQVSVRQALVFLLAQALVGLVVVLQFNGFAIALGVASLAIVAVYPFMKRVTDWPQAVLGLAFSWGALMGWAAAFGGLAAPALLLYAGAILWTVGYDTIYALQDQDDDAVVGVRSTARLFAGRTKPALAALYGAATVLFGAAFALAGVGPLACLGLAAGAAHLARQVATLRLGDASDARRKFRSNRDFGAILFAGLVLDALW